MEVILLDKVNKLGDLGDKVNVKNGYARNFLIPGGKAKPATPANLKEFEARRAELEKRSADLLTAAKGRQTQIEALDALVIKAKAGGEGKLFGSVGTFDIVEAAKAAGVELEKSELRLPKGNLREVGEYELTVHLHTDVEATLKVVVETDE